MENTHHLAMVPALYKAYSRCAVEERNKVVDVMRWIEHRGREVLKGLIVESPLPMAQEDTVEADLSNWQQVRAYHIPT